MIEVINQARMVDYDPTTDIIQLTDARCDEEDVEELNHMLAAGRLKLRPVHGWTPYNYLAETVCEEDLPCAWLVELVDVMPDETDPFD